MSALLLDDRRRTQAGDASATDQWRDQWNAATVSPLSDISQSSVATHLLRCGGIFSDSIITNLQLFSLKYIEDYQKLVNWKLGQDKTKLSCLVARCVHTADTDKTRQDSLSCPCRRCEQAMNERCVHSTVWHAVPLAERRCQEDVQRSTWSTRSVVDRSLHPRWGLPDDDWGQVMTSAQSMSLASWRHSDVRLQHIIHEQQQKQQHF